MLTGERLVTVMVIVMATTVVIIMVTTMGIGLDTHVGDMTQEMFITDVPQE
jgi:hypothetical protein